MKAVKRDFHWKVANNDYGLLRSCVEFYKIHTEATPESGAISVIRNLGVHEFSNNRSGFLHIRTFEYSFKEYSFWPGRSTRWTLDAEHYKVPPDTGKTTRWKVHSSDTSRCVTSRRDSSKTPSLGPKSAQVDEPSCLDIVIAWMSVFSTVTREAHCSDPLRIWGRALLTGLNSPCGRTYWAPTD